MHAGPSAPSPPALHPSAASPHAAFLLVSCHVGAESVVRRGIAEALPGARPAFARPGLLTFKRDAAFPPDLPRPHPLARTWGCSLGPVHSADALRAKIADLPSPVRVHVLVGEAGKPGKVPESVLGAWRKRADAVATDLAASIDPAVDGETVVEVVVRLDEPWVAAWHRHAPDRGPLPGGRWDLRPPPDAPSRAWSKLEELLAWARVAPAAGELALEVGGAPGGATVALLDRGVRVVSVDPQPVILPARLAGAPFTHVRAAIGGVPREGLPDGVAWIVLDANVPAPVALHALHRLVPRYRSTLRGVVATLKLNEWALVDQLPRWLSQLEEQGLRPVGAANLASFRQELGLVALIADDSTEL